jgi:hypothetical protein
MMGNNLQTDLNYGTSLGKVLSMQQEVSIKRSNQVEQKDATG